MLIQRSADGEEDIGGATDDDGEGTLRLFLRRCRALALLVKMRAWMVGVRRWKGGGKGKEARPLEAVGMTGYV